METLSEGQIQKGLDEAYKKAGHNAYFGNGFEAGVKFALKNLNGETVKGAKECRRLKKFDGCPRIANKNHCSKMNCYF